MRHSPMRNGAWPHAIAEIRDGTGKIVFRRSGSGLDES